jgi:hypothetical protein
MPLKAIFGFRRSCANDARMSARRRKCLLRRGGTAKFVSLVLSRAEAYGWRPPALSTLPFFRRQHGLPDIEDENDTQLVAVIASGALDRILEEQEFAFIPIPLLEPDTVGVSLRQDRRQVDDQPGVGLSGVWRHLRVRSKHRKHGVRAPAPAIKAMSTPLSARAALGSAPGGSGERSGWKAATNKMRRLPRLANAPKQCRSGKTFLLSDAAEVDHTVG